MGGPCPGGVYPGGSLSRGVSLSRWGLCPGGSLSRGCLSGGGSLSGGGGGFVRQTLHTVTCGQYASYWNAFLLISLFSEQAMKWEANLLLQYKLNLPFFNCIRSEKE